jgi:hypothetical protein
MTATAREDLPVISSISTMPKLYASVFSLTWPE